MHEAYHRELCAENTLNKARDVHEKTINKKAELSLKEQEIYEMKADAEIKMEAAQLFRQMGANREGDFPRWLSFRPSATAAEADCPAI